MKEYTLDIDKVGGDVYTIMSKGHHDPAKFMEAVRDAGYNWPLGNPVHVWIKVTPSRDDNYLCTYHIVDKAV